MSAGSKIVPVRIPDALHQEISLAIVLANETRKEEPYDMSSWIRKAIMEKLDHLRRGSGKADCWRKRRGLKGCQVAAEEATKHHYNLPVERPAILPDGD